MIDDWFLTAHKIGIVGNDDYEKMPNDEPQ